ncbi:MAG TPA: hypothetical protein VK718_09645 [Ferruginibacter sp.]|jgi:hypothetical protein|nr:hypothetical protein [Ferruginibacter sp.]
MAIKKPAFTMMLTGLLLLSAANLFAQNNDVVYCKWATKQHRAAAYQNIIKYAINKNLALPLTDSTENKWESGVASVELLQYRSPWTDSRIRYAFNSLAKRSVDFQTTFLECIYSVYPDEFSVEIQTIFDHATNDKVFAISAAYLYRAKIIDATIIKEAAIKLYKNYEQDAILKMLIETEETKSSKNWNKKLPEIFSKKFLPGNTIVYSIQRKNRDYIGLAIIRDSAGNFIVDSNKNIIAIPQFARSLSNLPFYLTGGNTPQGIFRMYGTDVSESNFIGPTPNIQLTMPFETSIKHFLKDSTITDSIWTETLYKKLLPKSWQDYSPVYQTYYAGKAGRTEIIAHGTTVDPDYYKSKIYYPYTPTEGCLCTKEIWNETDGKRMISDQQKLINAVKETGSDDGYYIVIEIDDQQKPVNLQELLPYIKN